MTEYLIATRAAIILWTNLAVIPAQILFDAIEVELERRGKPLLPESFVVLAIWNALISERNRGARLASI
jgi:hypothetical protein